MRENENSVTLRQLEEKDAEAMLEWIHDPEIQRAFRFNAEEKDRKAVLTFIRNAGIECIDGKDIHYAIADKHDEYLGTISLKNIDTTARKAEYSISLRREAQGKGIAAKATLIVLRLFFEQYHFERIYLNVLSENERAIRLYEKCGFVYEGEFRNHLFLRGEYKSLKWYRMLRTEYFAFYNILEETV